MERTHWLKLDEVYCDPVYHGDKLFEVRYNDRGYQKGDFIRFIPNNGMNHPIKGAVYKITYVHSGLGLENSYVVLGLAWVDNKSL